MAGRSEWNCWTLCREDIDHVARRLSVNPGNFIDDDYEGIARKFIKGFGWANEEWESILKEAINLHAMEKEKRRAGDMYAETNNVHGTAKERSAERR